MPALSIDYNRIAKARAMKKKKQKQDDYFRIRYVDLLRLTDAKNFLSRFILVAAKSDLNELQIGHKPFLFIAILKNDIHFTEYLLFREINLDEKYTIEGTFISIAEEDDNRPLEEPITALEYAKLLNRSEIVKMIESKMLEPSVESRWMKLVEEGNLEEVDKFRNKFQNPHQLKRILELGLIKAVEIGSLRLIDYFIVEQECDVNFVLEYNDIRVTPLCVAISNKKFEIAKYLLFRKADVKLAGQFGDALVTSIHCDSPINLVKLLLEKGADLAAKHPYWPKLSLREYCIQLNKVQAKLCLDEFIFHLIATGDYAKLKYISDNGYTSINITNRFGKNGRTLAVERCHPNIVKLIDKIEEKQRKLRTKMNYS